jgi:adenylate cyclase
MLAVFGLEGSVETACRAALAAAVRVGRNIRLLNIALTHELPTPIRFGIGIDAGPVILGELGFEEHNVLTVMGDAVNRAARLESLSKDFGCEVVVSDVVTERAGLAPEALPGRDVALPGRAGRLGVRHADGPGIEAALAAADGLRFAASSGLPRE